MTISLHGVGVADGVAIGVAHLVAQHDVDVRHRQLDVREIPAEIARFHAAVQQAQAILRQLCADLPANAPTELASFLELHIMLLEDEHLAQAPCAYIQEHSCNAEWALKMQRDVLIAQFDLMEDDYLRERRNDVIQVSNRLFATLAGQPTCPVTRHTDHQTILVAQDFGPADMVLFKEEQFAAFITDIGGVTSHTAILARSLGMPAVLALHNASRIIRNGDVIIVDGRTGVVLVDPNPTILAHYQARQFAWKTQQDSLHSLLDLPAITQDGEEVVLLANIELPSDAPTALARGAMGVGLFRSEFLFLGRDNLPDEEEQFLAYKSVLQSMPNAPVTIRTLDLGADKNPNWANHGFSANPALGLCGVRWSLTEPQLFRPQLRALLRAACYGQLHILLPMVGSISELEQCLALIKHLKQELIQEGVPLAQHVPIGAMIEIPAAALQSAAFAKRLDFLSIGTNDLIQYTLAIDRTNEAVGHLYDPLNPAVLQLIQMTIRHANAANVPVSVCGEMAGDVRLTRLLLGLGLRKFSMHPAHLLQIKQNIRLSNTQYCQQMAMQIVAEEEMQAQILMLSALNTGLS